MSGSSLDAQVTRAEELAGTGDAQAALPLLVDAADRDHAYAAALLGAWQVLGYVAAEDVEAGIRRLRSAAAAGESAACAFLGSTLLVYLNPQRRDCFGSEAVSPRRFHLHGRDGGRTTVEGPHLSGPQAEALRNGEYRRVDVVLGR